jgi:hypothetical protein
MSRNLQQYPPCTAAADIFFSFTSVRHIMDWIPAVFVVFKLLVLGTGMFFAVKWHYDQELKRGKEKRAVLRTGGRLAAVFVLALLGLGLITYLLITLLGM